MARKPVLRENLSAQLYNNLRSSLMEGAYAPGQRLTISGIAEEYGTSITPVREAIFRLASEKALEIKAATSVQVPKLVPEDLKEIKRIRTELEGYAAYRLATLINADQLAELRDMNAVFIEAAESDPLKASTFNRDFHFAVLKFANLPLLEGICENMWVLMGPFLREFHFGRMPVRQPSKTHKHHDLLAALDARDAEASRRAMQEDINWGQGGTPDARWNEWAPADARLATLLQSQQTK